jgi:DNA-binding XRE family transcriptional regulator
MARLRALEELMNGFYRNEAYDRLMAAQAAFVPLSVDGMAIAVDPVDNGERLKEARTKLAMTQAQLGEALDLTPVMIGLMERGEKDVGKRTDLAIRYLLSIR